MPEPIRIVTCRVVAARLSPSRLPARFGRHDGGFGDLDQVVELEGLDPRSVEGLALVLDRGATHALLDLRDLGHALGQQLLIAEHAAVRLHGRAQRVGDVRHLFAGGGGVQAGEARAREIASVLRQRLVRLAREILLDDVVARSPAEHDDVEQRIGAEAVAAVDRDTGALADRVKAVHDRVRIAVPRGHYLAVHVARNATHHVMDSRHHRYRLADGIHIGEFDRRQSLDDDLGTEVVELEQHMILLRPAAAALLDLLVHRPGDNVARGEILQVGSVALHEALAIDVEKDTAFAAHTLGDQHASGIDAGRMELPHFHVFERDAGTRSHAQPVTSVDERVGARGKDSLCAAGREEGRLDLQDHHIDDFRFQRGHPNQRKRECERARPALHRQPTADTSTDR